MIVRALQVLWPAFMAAGVLEMLVFAVVDPNELHWFGGVRIEWSAPTVYACTFLMFWAVITVSGAMTAVLMTKVQSKRANQGQSGRL